MSKNGIDGKLEILRRKEALLKTAIAAEKVRQMKKREKENARLFSVVGAALVQRAIKAPDFHLILKQVLQAADMCDADRAFLGGKGWV